MPRSVLPVPFEKVRKDEKNSKRLRSGKPAFAYRSGILQDLCIYEASSSLRSPYMKPQCLNHNDALHSAVDVTLTILYLVDDDLVLLPLSSSRCHKPLSKLVSPKVFPLFNSYIKIGHRLLFHHCLWWCRLCRAQNFVSSRVLEGLLQII